ncbi:MAG: GGDEF domain-containing protein [Oscillospiraceae bacterium]|nr:GGDEF domain-containing protein [Oscillospiraceae bacterium]
MIIGYLSDNWGILILITGIALLLQSNIHLDRHMVRSIYAVIGLLGVYTVTSYAEESLGNAPFYSPMRAVMTFLDYGLVSMILFFLVQIMFRERSFYLIIPACINIVGCLISLWTGIVFYFDTQTNSFQRGALGFLPYAVAGFYLIYLLVKLFRRFGKTAHEDSPVLSFMILTSVFCFLIPLFFWEDFNNSFSLTIAADVFIYYVFILHQMTKRDVLTGLLNRQTYNADSQKYAESITALIALDMNGLKEINDKNGHIAGDAALSALGKCFVQCTSGNERVYRIGGDEFAILCIRDSREEFERLTEKLREAIPETGYSCSIGWCYSATPRAIDSLYKEADAMLYEDKERYYLKTGKKRRCAGKEKGVTAK